MAITGYRCIIAMDESRLELISEYIWSFEYMKDLPVQIVYDDEIEEISAQQTRVRYLIKVRPDTELEEIKELLVKKKYIKE